MARRLTRLAVMVFRFLAKLGMTVRRSRIVATTPFYLLLSTPQDGRGDRSPSTANEGGGYAIVRFGDLLTGDGG